MARPQSISEQEWRARCDAAVLFRLIAHQGWGDFIFTHVSVRVPGEASHFLIQPFGLMFDEVTASSLLKVDFTGRIVAGDAALNPAGFTIHAAVYQARPDVNCVIHLHTDAGVAVSAQSGGLLPLNQTALIVRCDLAAHAYEGISLELSEQERLTSDLGSRNMMLLRHHGTLAVGVDAGSAFLRIYQLERACKMQILAQSGPCLAIDPAIEARVADQIRREIRGKTGVWPGNRVCDG